MTNLTDPIFQEETAARQHLEAVRWPNGPVCPHCGAFGNISPLGGKSMGPGWFYCADCKDKFTVRVGSIFERSHVPLHKWLLAFRLMTSSKKGMSAHQLHRSLDVTYKTAWFMAHRVREAMKEGPFSGQLGGAGKPVGADETFIGRKPGRKKRKGGGHKHAVLSLVERGGKVRSFHVQHVTSDGVRKVLVAQIDPASTLMTDEAAYYRKAGREFADHQTVNHSEEEYVRGLAHTNTLEGFFSIFKRGMVGVYQHCGEQHLKRYVTEFDFRFNHRSISDAERTIQALKGAEGRRLTYRRSH